MGCGVVILSDLGEPEVAAAFVGVADRITAQQGTTIGELDPRWDLPGIREWLRDALGESRYEEARSDGASLSDDDFVTYAITELRRVQQGISERAS